MDFLESLNIDILPEQQTRISDELAKLLKENPTCQVGFDVCCVCGKSKPTLVCKRCKRVWYCSSKCRDIDSSYHNQKDSDPESIDGCSNSSEGHSPIICSLLRKCNLDEDYEESIQDSIPSSSSSSGSRSLLLETKKKYSKEEIQEAEFRVASEQESYAATLANILYTSVVSSNNIQTKTNTSSTEETTTIHIIGASQDAELCNMKNYTEAFADLLSFDSSMGDDDDDDDPQEQKNNKKKKEKRKKRVHLIFIGPDCQENIKNSSISNDHIIKFSSCKSIYDKALLQKIPKANALIFFNPGFTCQDYKHWDDTLDVIRETYLMKEKKIPFLITTNTEMEAIMDCQYLHERQIIPYLPKVIEQMIQLEEQDRKVESNDDESTPTAEDIEEGEIMYFTENPYAGLRVRQSGTMANDLYIKNKYLIGGIMMDARKKKSASKEEKQNKTKRSSSTEDKDELKTKKKLKQKKRRKNAALI